MARYKFRIIIIIIISPFKGSRAVRGHRDITFLTDTTKFGSRSPRSSFGWYINVFKCWEI